MTLWGAFFAVYLIGLLIPAWSFGQLKRFLATTRGISDASSLERFKELARTQMYLALGFMGLVGVGGIVLGVVLVSRHGLKALLAVILANAVVFAVGLLHKRVENQARSLPTTSPELAAPYREVCETWLKKPLPDF